ncbi:MAG: hypothetical protein HKM04_09825 [Legionellales bacterium]|nr:hypothetical protein [Legionellales bacterium]
MLSIFQLSDLHIWPDPDKVHLGRSPLKQLEAAINEVNKRVCEDKLVILTGDLTNAPHPDAYRLLAQTLEKLEAPIYVIPGNHDDKSMMDAYLNGKNIFHDTTIKKNKWRITLLDSSPPGKIPASGKLVAEELARLEKLSANNEEYVLIFLHHPPILFGSTWFRTVCLENRDEFNILVQHNPRIKAVVFGHAHTQYNAYANNTLYICAPSIWLQFEHTVNDRTAYSNTLGGYNWYELTSDGNLSFGTHYFSVTY